MPPPEAVEPPVGNIAAYPNDILRLGTNRWPTITGEVINTEFGDPVDLTPNTLAFWGAAALRGTGKPLHRPLCLRARYRGRAVVWRPKNQPDASVNSTAFPSGSLAVTSIPGRLMTE